MEVDIAGSPLEEGQLQPLRSSPRPLPPLTPTCDEKVQAPSTQPDDILNSSTLKNSPPAVLSSQAVPTQAVPATTKQTTDTARVSPVQEMPRSAREKSANDGWASPIPASGSDWGALPTPAESWGPPTQTTSASAWGGTSSWNLKTTSREDRSEGSVEHGRGPGRGSGRGRDRGWSGFGGVGRRDVLSSRDQSLTKSFKQLSTPFSNPDSGWGAHSGINHRTSENSPTRGYWQERSTLSASGMSIPTPPIYQTQTPMELQLHQSPPDPTPFAPPPPVATRPVLWPLHTELTLKRDFSRHTSKIAKYQARLTEVGTRQRHVHDWYNSQVTSLPQLHPDDHETLEQELNKVRLRRDDNLAALQVDEKKYGGLAEVEWTLLIQTLKEEMVRTLENGVHELLWKMTTVAGDGRKGFDINCALQELVRTAMPSIIEGPLQQYAEAIVKATEKESCKVQAAAVVEDHPMKEQPDTSLDVQAILDRLEQENTDLKEKDRQTQEDVSLLRKEVDSLRKEVRSLREEALGWTLEDQDHPIARQIQEKVQKEREFIIDGITSTLQHVFGTVLDHRLPDI